VTTQTRAAAVLALGFLAFHLPFLPSSLEDLDSINFALGLRQFDVAQHQPHPPGYPVFIFIVRAVNAVVGSEVHALSLVSIVSGALAVVAMSKVFQIWTEPGAPTWVPMGATVIAATSPLFWLTASRPLSDMMGLAASLGIQAMALTARSDAVLGLAALCAGVAAGIRSQTVWLTVPTLILAIVARPSTYGRVRAATHALAGLVVGMLAWGVPLLALSGGPASYARALATQGSEDFTGVAMLATNPSPRQLAFTLHYAFIAPWAAWPLGVAVVVAALAGLARLGRVAGRRLLLPLVAFAPYAVFDLLFQEMVTTRYALPLLVPVAYLAVRGTAALPARVGSVLTVGAAAAGLMLTGPALMAYANTPAPAFRMLAAMGSIAGSTSTDERPVLAMHRRQELDMRRPITWNSDRLPTLDGHLAAPPKHEWLELVKYWNGGGRRPVWFVADPPRSDLALVDRRSVRLLGEYRWTIAWPTLLGGVRPNVMDWYRIQPPGWYLGEGWALTPETAGVARDEARGPGRSPIQGWIRRRSGPVTLMLGGRNLSAAGPEVPLSLTVDSRAVHDRTVAPGFFFQFLTLEPEKLVGAGDYATLEIKAGSDQIAIEQFDAQAQGETVFGFAEGWHELEYNPSSGRLWRWTSDRATIRLRSRPRRLALRLRGTFETSAASAHVTVRIGDRVVSEHDVPKEFDLETSIPAELVASDVDTLLTLETDAWYVPAETNWRPTADRRRLGLRIYECEITPIP
jgi:hypothetical protein